MSELQDIQDMKDVKLLVNSFYDKIQKDNLLGRIFNDVAGVNWDKHLPVMYNFWESLLLNGTNYKGQTLEAHLKIHQLERLTAAHFEKWLALFKETVDENFQGNVAEQAKIRAMSIALVLQTKLSKAAN